MDKSDSKTCVQARIISDVILERDRQEKLWGEENHELSRWTGIIGEEFGELCEAINETVFNNGPEKKILGGYENMKKEGTHLAATAVKFLEYLERYKDNFASTVGEK